MTEQQALDRILEMQFIVAWAGEGRTHPPRQPWWRTNWVDEYGGYDLLQRVVPRTAAWAQYELVREAARRVDGHDLEKQAEAENIRTLFHLGPEVDRALAERLLELKSSEVDPVEALPGLRATRGAWNADEFKGFLGDMGEKRNFAPEPFGKRLTGDAPEGPTELVRALAQGLLPLGDTFPRPYAVVG